MKRKKLRSLKSLKKELDRLFSIYVRRRGAVDGIATCVSCGARMPWQRIQAGHYASRRHMNTRWRADNCYPQCARCNIFLRGNYPAYSAFLIREFGHEVPEALHIESSMPVNFTRSDLEALIEHYQNAIGNLQN